MKANCQPVIVNGIAQMEYFMQDDNGKFLRIMTEEDKREVEKATTKALLKMLSKP